MRPSSDEAAERTGEGSARVREFVALNRRRLRGDSQGAVERARWAELRDQLAVALGAVLPGVGPRRRTLRVRTHLKVLVTTNLAQELLHAHELGECGLFLRCERPPAPGTPLQLELQDRAGRSLELEGSVAWARREPDGRGPAGMGVVLHALSDWDRMRLAGLVEAELDAL